MNPLKTFLKFRPHSILRVSTSQLLATWSFALAFFCVQAPAHAATTELRLAPAGAASAGLGSSVADAGDVNGDGYADFLVGSAGDGAGRVHLHYGGKALDDTPDLTFDGEVIGDQFGHTVAGAGDVNGDGYADVIVGAHQNDSGGTDSGRAYVFFGGSTIDNVADLVFTGVPDDFLGFAVCGAGDVNGDGFDDLLLGVPLSDEIAPSAGRAYVYFGGPNADEIADLAFDGEATGDLFGYSVSPAGDINNDGHSDIIVGAYSSDAAFVNAGRAYVFHGGPAMDTVPDLVLDGEAEHDGFATSVSGGVDLNADGFDDVVAASRFGNGRVSVFYGGPGADASADLWIDENFANPAYVPLVSVSEDLNGDSYDDLIIGDQVASNGLVDPGRAYVYFGGPTMDASADLVFTGEANGDVFGISVSGAGDLDGDGIAELIVGATENDFGGSGAGRVYVYSTYPYRVLSPNGGEQWVAGETALIRWRGKDVADIAFSSNGGATWNSIAKGVGGDLLNEVSVVVPSAITDGALIRITAQTELASQENSDLSDKTFTIVAPNDPPRAVLHRQFDFKGAEADDYLGNSVAGIGDFNGDGFADYAIGARRSDGAAGNEVGHVYVHFGGPDADDVPDLTLTGEAAFDELGTSVTGPGDFNGDGYDDIAVSASGYGPVSGFAGRVYFFYGGPSADEIPDLILDGIGETFLYGISIAGVGDVNGDYFPDLLVGAPGNGVESTEGFAYLYYGGPFEDTLPDLTLTGEALFDRFGYRVAAAGDVNGDGYADLLIGADLHDTNGDDSGRAYLFYGGIEPDATPDLVLSGEGPGSQFGWPVAGPGDINGDGYDDLLISANGENSAGEERGRTYLYHGGPALDAQPDLVLDGEAPFSRLGTSLAGAGDVNGDGYADFLVAAHWWERSYLYYGGPGADAEPDHVIETGNWEEFFGISLAGVGDVNGDGLDDILIGASFNNENGVQAGAAYLYNCSRYTLLSPNEGDTWSVGASETIAWNGAEPADIWLSVDGGNDYSLLESDVGGAESNAIQLTVPHQPTRFAKVRVTPHDPQVTGQARSDSLFTIEASIELFEFVLQREEGGSGVVLRWNTDPGPESLAGYRVERATASSDDWLTLADLVKETTYHDVDGRAGMRYRLSGVNGLGEELILGEASLAPLAPLAAWPVPYRGGELHVAFATHGGRGGGAGAAEVSIFDTQGRRVRTLAQGEFTAGQHSTVWDGKDGDGRLAPAGVYFVRSQSAGEHAQLKLVVLR